MIRICDLPDWRAADDGNGQWTVREKMGDEYVLLIASGTEENCRMAAIGPWALRLLDSLIKSDGSEQSRVYLVTRAKQLLKSAGVTE